MTNVPDIDGDNHQPRSGYSAGQLAFVAVCLLDRVVITFDIAP
jgi:hypothetical protein